MKSIAIISRFIRSARSTVLIAISLLTCLAQAADKQTQSILLTDTWAPYINPEGEKKGTAASIMDILLNESGVNAQWRYLPYEIAFEQIKNQSQLFSYPYFKTRSRAEFVLYSDPVFTVTSRVYYNRQYLSSLEAEQAYKDKKRIGKVAGYSYGESLDQGLGEATVFANEKQALSALFNHKIDLLPMTQSVMQANLSRHFPQRQQLIMPLPQISDISNLHVIAAKNSAGKELINRINKAMDSLKALDLKSLQGKPFEAPEPVDVARLITAEGYPAILGQTLSSGADIEFYTLPQGTRVLVMVWSDKIKSPSSNDRIYQNMMDLSKVVVLNGPHVGKVLFVRNMHIELL